MIFQIKHILEIKLCIIKHKQFNALENLSSDNSVKNRKQSCYKSLSHMLLCTLKWLFIILECRVSSIEDTISILISAEFKFLLLRK